MTDPLVLQEGPTAPLNFDRRAICRITIEAADGRVLSRGTGTLVFRHPPNADGSAPSAETLAREAPGLVLSALHVVANRRPDPPEPMPGRIVLTFPTFTTSGTIVAGAWDRIADWVLIECADWPPLTPMRVARLIESGRTWESFGFPEANPNGMKLNGVVTDCDARLESVPAHQLSCEQAAAGGGGKVAGMSGAPLVIDERLVGVMRFALMDSGRTEMGTLYACPVAAVSSKWPLLDAPELPLRPRPLSLMEVMTQSAGRELFAITAASLFVVVVVMLLATIRVPSMNLEGTVQTSAVRFALATRGPLGIETDNGLLAVSRLTVSGIREAEGLELTPEQRDDAGIQSDGVLELALPPDATARDLLVLDLGAPLTAGTRVLLARDAGSRTVSRYKLVLGNLGAPIPVAFRGGVSGIYRHGLADVPIDGAPAAPRPGTNAAPSVRPARERTLLLSTDDQLEITIELPSSVKRDEAQSDGNLAVQSLAFLADSARSVVRIPAIRSGVLLLDGRASGNEVRLHLRDSLAIGADTMRISGLSIPGENGMIAVAFGGRVHSLRLGSADGTTLTLMPTWLTRVRLRYPVQAFVSALAVALFVASMWLRRTKRLGSAS